VTRSDGRQPTRRPEQFGRRAGTAWIAVDLLGGDNAPDVVVDGAPPGPWAEYDQYEHLARRRIAAGEAIVVATTRGVAS
jgi:hypothetical protein